MSSVKGVRAGALRVCSLAMLTRSVVAKRLGKSLATVRRIEGVLLDATIGTRGVHYFDEREVSLLRGRIRREPDLVTRSPVSR
jgi:hypothetical protein